MSTKIPSKKIKNGFSLPILGLGTWQMGGRFERDLQNDDAADIESIRSAIQAGVTHLDTAEAYAAGYTDILIAQAIKGFDRKKLILASKINKVNATFDKVLQSFEGILERLSIDYLDLLYLHSPSQDNIPIRETMKAFNKLKDEGLVKNLAVSNFSIKQFEEAQSWSNAKLVANQVHYNVLVREVERKGLLKFCQDQDVMLVAYRPLQKGLFLDKPALILTKYAKKYQKTPAQIALNWLMSQKNVVTICKMQTKKHLLENLGACNFSLTNTEIEDIRKNYPEQMLESDVHVL